MTDERFYYTNSENPPSGDVCIHAHLEKSFARQHIGATDRRTWEVKMAYQHKFTPDCSSIMGMLEGYVIATKEVVCGK